MKPKMMITLILILTMIWGQVLPGLAAQNPAQKETLSRGQRKGRVINSYRVRRGAGDDEKLNQEKGRPEWVNSTVRRSAAHLEFQKQQLGLSEINEDLRLSAADQDDFGKTHLRLQQRHNGVEVFGSQLVSHLEGEAVTINQ